MSPEKQKKAQAVEGLQRIPQPPTVPVEGNLPSLDVDDPTTSFAKLAAQYGPIYKLSVMGLDMVVLSSWKLVDEACDDKRFQKSLQGDLEVRGPSWGLGLPRAR